VAFIAYLCLLSLHLTLTAAAAVLLSLLYPHARNRHIRCLALRPAIIREKTIRLLRALAVASSSPSSSPSSSLYIRTVVEQECGNKKLPTAVELLNLKRSNGRRFRRRYCATDIPDVVSCWLHDNTRATTHPTFSCSLRISICAPYLSLSLSIASALVTPYLLISTSLLHNVVSCT
jgi:hypothetical protein